jgi:3-hydroxybutyryl-CoA dehydratase
MHSPSRRGRNRLEELELKTVPAPGDSFTYPFTISQEQITSFARITGDTNPIHVYCEAAEAGEFGGCIAHGVLLLGVFSKIFGTILYAEGQIVLGMETRFLSLVRPGLSYIAVVAVIETLLEKSQEIYRMEMFGEDGKEVLRGSCQLLNRKLYVPHDVDH